MTLVRRIERWLRMRWAVNIGGRIGYELSNTGVGWWLWRLLGRPKIYFGVDQAGFHGNLKCGTINLFDGWAANRDPGDPVVSIQVLVGSDELGRIALLKDRPDWEKQFGRLKTGFSGVVNIPRGCLGKTLTLMAVTQSGQSEPIAEYDLKDALTDAEIEFRRLNRIPDDTLQNLVVQDVDPARFLEMGKVAVEQVIEVLGSHQVAVTDLKAVLDFGVGCGRVMRWWHEWAGQVQFWGTDINPTLVDWCNKNLDFGTYRVNGLLPPTDFENAQFGLVYAFSVFSHLAFESQGAWLDEFARILGPEKYLLISVHGDLLAQYLPPAALREYRRKGHYILSQDAEGENLCAAYQNHEFSVKLFSPKFVVLDYLPGALKACGVQDLYLLRKREW